MSSLATSVVLHGLFLGLAFSISPLASFAPAQKVPVRITYFKAPTLVLPPSGPNNVAAPIVATIPDTLAPRPITASSIAPPEGGVTSIAAATDPRLGVTAGLGQGPAQGTEEGSDGADLTAAGAADDTLDGAKAPTPKAVASLPSGQPQSIVPIAPAEPKATPNPKASKGPKLQQNDSDSTFGTPSIKVTGSADEGGAVSVAPVKAETPPPPKAEPPAAVASLTTGGGILVIKKGMAQPVLTKKVVPRYPPMAKAQRVKGIVIVTVTVDERGRVVDADIATSPSPLLNAEALAAASKMRFAPYRVDGQPVMFMTRVPFRFDFR